MPIVTGTTSKKPPKHSRHEEADGIRISPGPFIGIVKNNIDPMRSGRLQIWIAELGGDPEDSKYWRTVRYCSPFFGSTPSSVRQNGQNFDGGAPHSYGMWMVPPDLEVQVICTFINGDPFKGFWFGVIPEWPMLHMVPGISSGKWHGGSPDPLVEYNDQDTGQTVDANGNPTGDTSTTNGLENFYKRANTTHEVQKQNYLKQGLLQDPLRGPGSSSAFRETPSRVFGISTPGAEYNFAANGSAASQSNTNQQIDTRVSSRKGGHQFVMDDGDVNGDNQLIKLRTSNGNMLLMNDTAGFIYLINGSGSAWFEMDNTGNVRVFSQGKVEMHATSGFCFETPGSINLTGNTIDIAAKSSVKISGATVDISGSGGVKVGGKGELHLSGSKSYLSAKECIGFIAKQHIDMMSGCITFNTKKVNEAKAPASAATCDGPTHEPYSGHVNSKTTSPVTGASFGAVNGLPDGAAGNYGAAGSFGLTSQPNYYGVYTNANGPIKFNTGLQGSLQGQAAVKYTGSNTTTTSATGTNNIADPNPANLNQYDKNAVLYTDTNVKLPVATNGFAVNVNDPTVAKATDLTPGEKQNNPADLIAINLDPFSIGQNNGINVYATPEDGIAALSELLDVIQAEGAQTVADFIEGYISRKGAVAK